MATNGLPPLSHPAIGGRSIAELEQIGTGVTVLRKFDPGQWEEPDRPTVYVGGR